MINRLIQSWPSNQEQRYVITLFRNAISAVVLQRSDVLLLLIPEPRQEGSRRGKFPQRLMVQLSHISQCFKVISPLFLTFVTILVEKDSSYR